MGSVPSLPNGSSPDHGRPAQRITSSAWQIAVRDADKALLPPGSKHLAYVMATYADFKDGRNCRPGDKTLGEKIGRSKRTVKRRRAPLVKAGFLQLQRRGLSAGRGHRNEEGRAAVWQLILPPNEGPSDPPSIPGMRGHP
jgi:hypothetical protein